MALLAFEYTRTHKYENVLHLKKTFFFSAVQRSAIALTRKRRQKRVN